MANKDRSQLKIGAEYSMFDMLGKHISDAISNGEISPAEAGRMILSSNLKSLEMSEDDQKQYLNNLLKGTNLSGY